MKSLRLQDYLEHILEAVERIGRYTAGFDEERFLLDSLVQDAVLRNFENIGEASSNIMKNSPEFAASHRDILLRSAYEMRNALSHGYFQVDLATVWRTSKEDLPPLREKVTAALRELQG